LGGQALLHFVLSLQSHQLTLGILFADELLTPQESYECDIVTDWCDHDPISEWRLAYAETVLMQF
jgi:hypothetical protein